MARQQRNAPKEPTEDGHADGQDTRKRRFFTWFTETVRLYLFTLLVITWTAVALWKPISWLVWDTWAEPLVECKIDDKIEPIIRELEFQNSLLMKDMTLEEIRSLEREYAEYRRMQRFHTQP